MDYPSKNVFMRAMKGNEKTRFSDIFTKTYLYGGNVDDNI